MKRKTKTFLKTALVTTLGVGAIVGVASGVNALVKKEELKEIHPVFSIGGLDENGKYEKSDKTIYTKSAFECKGLDIDLDFDATIAYQVFYYESDGDFVSATSVYEDNNIRLVVPENVTHARLEITPLWEKMGEEYLELESQKIKFVDVATYATQLEISVLKDQEVKELSYDMNLLTDKDIGVLAKSGETGYYFGEPTTLRQGVIDLKDYSAFSKVYIKNNRLIGTKSSNGYEYWCGVTFVTNEEVVSGEDAHFATGYGMISEHEINGKEVELSIPKNATYMFVTIHNEYSTDSTINNVKPEQIIFKK